MSAAVESLLGGGREKCLWLDVLLYEYDSVRCLACVFVCGASVKRDAGRGGATTIVKGGGGMGGGDRRLKSLQGSSSSAGLVSERALQEAKHKSLPHSLLSFFALHSLQAEHTHTNTHTHAASPTFLMFGLFSRVIQQNVV